MDNKYKGVWKLLSWDIQVDILSRLSTKNLLVVEGICKNWQSIIKSPRFHMLHIKTNPYQDTIIMQLASKQEKCQIQPLDRSEVYEFDIPIVNPSCKHQKEILAIKQQLGICKCYHDKGKIYSIFGFFAHDLQSSTYKIFLTCNQRVCIYNSSYHTWQNLDSFSNFRDSVFTPHSCVMYKNHIYLDFLTRDYESMMASHQVAIYDPINDAWEKFNLNIKEYEVYYIWKLIIATDP